MKVKIEALNDQGKGICYIDSKITFVSDSVVGDIIIPRIVSEHKKYNNAVIEKLIIPSKKRIKAMCPYYSKCGGCQLQNISYEDTLLFKKNKLSNILKKFAKIETPITFIPNESKFNYRNKITLRIENTIIGLYEEETHNLIPIESCLMVQQPINDFIKILPDFNLINAKVVIRCNYNDELLINIITDDLIILPSINNLKIVGILHNNKVLYGDNKFMEIINHKLFQVSYDSFFQINRHICSLLFTIIRDNILRNKNVLDLYCGVGTLGINVSDIESKIYGIEIIENAILNATLNARINNVNNAKYMLGKVEDILPKIKEKIDVAIIDPPRKGLDKKTINILLNLNLEQIIYVSCDPITLSRDLNILKEKYNVVKVIGLDMFSYTYHVESVVILEKIK